MEGLLRCDGEAVCVREGVGQGEGVAVWEGVSLREGRGEAPPSPGEAVPSARAPPPTATHTCTPTTGTQGRSTEGEGGVCTG